MTKLEMQQRIESFGYLVTFKANQCIISDPLSNNEGFHLTVDTLEEAYAEMDDGGMFDYDEEVI